jgi:hypothetical protein
MGWKIKDVAFFEKVDIAQQGPPEADMRIESS